MIDFEHGALRRSGEKALAGILLSGVLAGDESRALSFLAGAAQLELEEWETALAEEYRRRAASRTSRRKRSTLTTPRSSGGSTLITTVRPSAVSVARKTRDIPPPPSSRSTVYASPSAACS